MDVEMIAEREAIEREDFPLAVNILIGPAYSANVLVPYPLGYLYFSSPMWPSRIHSLA